MSTADDRRSDRAGGLLRLHSGPGFVLPNAWDAGSARMFEQLGFTAVATTSAGIAWSCGLPDGGAMDRDTMLEHVARIVGELAIVGAKLAESATQAGSFARATRSPTRNRTAR